MTSYYSHALLLGLFFILIQSQSQSQSRSNLVLNGDFEASRIVSFPEYQFTSQCPDSWQCHQTQYIEKSFRPNMLFGRFVDLRHQSHNGNLTQNINITSNGTCLLEYYFASYQATGAYSYYMCQLKVFFNDTMIDFQKNPSNWLKQYQSVKFRVTGGIGQLRFTQASSFPNCFGSAIDNISLTCAYNSLPESLSPSKPSSDTRNQSPTSETELINTSSVNQSANSLLSQPVSSTVSFALSTPIVSSVQVTRQLLLMMADLWLYNFTKGQYKEIVRDIFNTISEVEKEKLKSASKFIPLKKLSTENWINSNLLKFTDSSLIEKDESSTVFLDSVLCFLVYTVPQTTIICLLMYAIYLLLKNKCQKIKQSLKRYSYWKTMIVFSLLQQNITFFTFVCFCHIQLSFFFNFIDKIFISLTLIIMLSLLIFSCCFFMLLGRFRNNWTDPLKDGIKTSFRGHKFLTSKTIFRSFLRGCVFFFFKDFYMKQMGILASIQILTILIVFYFNYIKNSEIFRKNIDYCLCIVYHLLFAGLNMSFFIHGYTKQYFFDFPMLENYVLKLESICVYLLLGLVLFKVLVSIIPSSWLKHASYQNGKPKQTSQKDQQKIENTTSLKINNPNIKLRNQQTQKIGSTLKKLRNVGCQNNLKPRLGKQQLAMMIRQKNKNKNYFLIRVEQAEIAFMKKQKNAVKIEQRSHNWLERIRDKLKTQK